MTTRRDLLAIGVGLMALAVLFSACGTKRAVTDPVVFPPSPETPRIQFLTRFKDSRDVDSGKSFFEAVVGESEETKAIQKPYGVSIDAGKIYVCDTRLNTVAILDLDRESFDFIQPSNWGGLKEPINCFVDKEDGSLYVTDVETEQVVIFDAEGNFLSRFGEGIRPMDVFVSGDTIWVADTKQSGEGQVHLYDKRTFKRMLSIPGAERDSLNHLNFPTNIFVRDDKLYVSDFGNASVKIFSRGGEYLASVGNFGSGLGQFARPKGIAVDRDGNLYVVDALLNHVQIFNPAGELLLLFGGGYGGPGAMSVPAKVTIDYDNLKYFEQYVYEGFTLNYLILVTNQSGPDMVSVYGFVASTENVAQVR